MAQPARIMVLAAAGIALIGGCAHRVPLDEMMQLPIERLRPDDRLRQDTVLVGMLEGIPKMPPEGTIETIYRVFKAEYPEAGVARANSCGWFCQGAGGLAAYFAPLVILPVAIVALPVVGVYEVTKPSDSRGGAGAKPAVDPAVLAREEEQRQVFLQESARRLSTVALEGQFPATWDDAYISALRQGLDGNRPPVDRPAAQLQGSHTGRPRHATAQDYFGAGISRMVLVGSTSGEQTLIICARSFLQSEVTRARDFETCQGGSIDLADQQDGGRRLRATLLEKGRQLAFLQAKAMQGGGTIEIVHADVVRGTRFPAIGKVAGSRTSSAGTLFVDLDSIGPAGRTDFRASLVVNLMAIEKGPMSQRIDVQVACVPGTVRYHKQQSYAEWYAEGGALETSTVIEIAPAPVLDAAVRLICDVGPKLRNG